MGIAVGGTFALIVWSWLVFSFLLHQQAPFQVQAIPPPTTAEGRSSVRGGSYRENVAYGSVQTINLKANKAYMQH